MMIGKTRVQKMKKTKKQQQVHSYHLNVLNYIYIYGTFISKITTLEQKIKRIHNKNDFFFLNCIWGHGRPSLVISVLTFNGSVKKKRKVCYKNKIRMVEGGFYVTEQPPLTGYTSFDPYLKLWLVGVFDPVLTGSLMSANKLVYPENSDTGVRIRWSTSVPGSLP